MAPIHSSHAKRLALEQISALAERGAPDVLGLIERGHLISWPERELQYALRQVAISVEREFDPLALIAYLCRPQLIAAVNKEIDSLADDKSALSAKEREERAQTIQRDILEVEFEEESLVMQALENGLKIIRRSDADPRAVLGLSADMPSPHILGAPEQKLKRRVPLSTLATGVWRKR
jgi:hypothetical protein